MNVTTYQVERVGDFGWPSDASSTDMTDIAIDQFGVLFGISYRDVFTCHPETAVCTRLAGLPEQFNGLTVIPQGTLMPDREVPGMRATACQRPILIASVVDQSEASSSWGPSAASS